MSEDIASNVELMPIVKGVIVSVIMVLIGLQWGNLTIELIGIIMGGAISGFISNNSTSYAILYGAIIGFISSFLLLDVILFALPLFMIVGVFGGFIGKVLKSNLE